jgi:hypothetical protein
MDRPIDIRGKLARDSADLLPSCLVCDDPNTELAGRPFPRLDETRSASGTRPSRRGFVTSPVLDRKLLLDRAP